MHSRLTCLSFKPNSKTSSMIVNRGIRVPSLLKLPLSKSLGSNATLPLPSYAPDSCPGPTPAIPTREFGTEDELDGAGDLAAARRLLPLDADASKPLLFGFGDVPAAPRRRVRPSDMVTVGYEERLGYGLMIRFGRVRCFDVGLERGFRRSGDKQGA